MYPRLLEIVQHLPGEMCIGKSLGVDSTPVAMNDNSTKRLLQFQIIVEIAIVALCAVTYYVGKQSLASVMVLFVALQVFSVLGLIWGLRMRRKIEAQDDKLPLDKRR